MRRSFLIALLLAGCAPSPSTSDQIVALYRGKSIEEVYARWGSPQDVRELGSGTIYVWTSPMTYIPAGSMRPTGLGASPFAITTTKQISTLGCREEIQTDPQRRIVAIKGDGNRGACDAMLNRLKG
jgi:hypothetical protein